MASIRREILIEAAPAEVWDALQDWGALHRRLVPGFATGCRLDGNGDRIVTFFNGAVVRERLIASDEEVRRLVWSIVDGPYTHHNGAAQVLAGDGDEADLTRFVWIADLLPDETSEATAGMMERGLSTIKATLEAVAPDAG